MQYTRYSNSRQYLLLPLIVAGIFFFFHVCFSHYAGLFHLSTFSTTSARAGILLLIVAISILVS